MKKTLIVTLALLTLLSAPLMAQTNQAQTTLSAAIDATQTQITVASATGITTSTTLLVDQEFMDVTAISGTRVTVFRGRGGSIQQAHESAAKVQTLAAGSVYTVARVGPCTVGSGAASYHPIAINVNSSTVWLQGCRGGQWVATWVLPLTVDSVMNVP